MRAVVDTAVLIPAFTDADTTGDLARNILGSASHLLAPSFIDVEFTHALRGRVRGGKLDDAIALAALEDIGALPLDRYDVTQFLLRIWDLRHNLTAYDAAYVALAEFADATLVTADGRLARASGMQCPVEFVDAGN